MLAEFCQTCNIISVQEHWPLPSDLECLAAVDCQMTSFPRNSSTSTILKIKQTIVFSIAQLETLVNLQRPWKGVVKIFFFVLLENGNWNYGRIGLLECFMKDDNKMVWESGFGECCLWETLFWMVAWIL